MRHGWQFRQRRAAKSVCGTLAIGTLTVFVVMLLLLLAVALVPVVVMQTMYRRRQVRQRLESVHEKRVQDLMRANVISFPGAFVDVISKDADRRSRR